MKILVEEYQYDAALVRDVLQGIDALQNVEGLVSLSYVGYFYNPKLNGGKGDTVFILPKVLMNEQGRVFSKYAPDDIIHMDTSKLNDQERKFLYEFAVWIYRAVDVYQRSHKDSDIVYHRKISQVGRGMKKRTNTLLDILLSLIQFNKDNQSLITFILKNLHSGFNKINWTKTISRGQAVIQDDAPVYIDVVNRKRQVNLEEELFIIFFSILRHMQVRYGFPVKINYNFPLITDEAFENYLDGYGEMRLIQIRHKYFADKQVQMWQLCYDFFSQQSQIHNNTNYSDHLLAKDFNIVFEEMIDHLLSEKDKRVDKMKLKEQIDGKRVDHIYAWNGLMHKEDEIFYIGDSKYYKQKNDPREYSVYKQYTYARNVIQANLDLFNKKDSKGKKLYKPGDDYLIYRDEDTEGYNITPNFFIRAHVPEDRDYDGDDLRPDGKMKRIIHFENRLFDRDTLLLQNYDINFLYVLSVYGSEDVSAQDTFKKKARKLFRERIIEDIQGKYGFFSLQLKPIEIKATDDEEEDSDLDKMNRLIEQKYFRKLLGKAFRPYKEEEFLYLSLESKPEYYDDNMKLLSDLSKDFNIRHYKLGTDPRAVINKFADLTFAPTKGQGGESHVFRFEDFKDEIFLIGGYRSGDKNQLDWIKAHLMYNIRASVNRHGYRNGIIDENVVSARYLILYEINDKEKRNYHIYRIDSWKTRSTEWMTNNGYEKPNGPYIVYSLSEEMHFEEISVNGMLNIGLYNEIAFRKPKGYDVSEEWLCDVWRGSPIFLTGKLINDYALKSPKDSQKALIVVNIGDSELSKLDIGFSASLFLAHRTPKAIKDFSSAGLIVYSNKKSYKVFRVSGDASISIVAPDGYLQRRYAEPLKEKYPDRKERDKVPADFFLSFKVEQIEDNYALNQSRINKVPDGLSGYDPHVAEVVSLKNS
jgi:hypothetical protein